MKPSEEIEIWTLTPKNIPEYCRRTGADEEQIMNQYRYALTTNNIVVGAFLPYPRQNPKKEEVMDAPLCPECAQGKTDNCTGMALDPKTDDFVPCETMIVRGQE